MATFYLYVAFFLGSGSNISKMKKRRQGKERFGNEHVESKQACMHLLHPIIN